MMQKLTPGQCAIRELFTAELPRFLGTDKDTREQSLLFREIRQRMSLMPSIVEDHITGAGLGYTRLARSYFLWLKQARSVEAQSQVTVFPLDHFIYRYDAIFAGDPLLAAYLGGMGSIAHWDNDPPGRQALSVLESLNVYVGDSQYVRSGPEPVQPKWATTYWALFELARTGTIPPVYHEPISLAYYRHLGILMAGNGGNHRTLAHVLWGEPQIEHIGLTVYNGDVQIDQDLNQALLYLEARLCRLHVVDREVFRELRPEFRLQDYSVEQIRAIVDFVGTTDAEEWDVLWQYALTRPIGEHRAITIEWLVTYRAELRRLRGITPGPHWYDSLVARLGHHPLSPGTFERWWRGGKE